MERRLSDTFCPRKAVSNQKSGPSHLTGCLGGHGHLEGDSAGLIAWSVLRRRMTNKSSIRRRG